MVTVIQPGLFTTVQDGGRWGYQRFGVPVAGPMDRVSHRLVNLIVGNRSSAATLEVTLVGPQLEFADETLFAVTGGEFELQLDGTSVATNTSHAARAGQCLTFGRRLEGARAYLAVAGGFDLPSVLGSRSTHVASGMGGLEGRALKVGDRLPVGHAGERRVRAGRVRARVVPVPRQGARVRVIIGPDDDRFGPEGVATLRTTRYQVTAQSDRMGYRLKGARLEQTAGGNLISSAALTGSVQVPTSGEPIILMADHQTTGGYPRIATVITADLPVVGQLSPSDWIEFELCNQEVALRALIEQEQVLMGAGG